MHTFVPTDLRSPNFHRCRSYFYQLLMYNHFHVTTFEEQITSERRGMSLTVLGENSE